MGVPLHYSLELPQRSLQLIEELWPRVTCTRERAHPELGSLTTTFLISMSIPIINLPIERMQRQKSGSGYADDRHITPELTDTVDTVLGKGVLQDTPFNSRNVWRFVSCEPTFNIADPLPNNVATALNDEAAAIEANKMQTSQWCSILRNAMAHGGVAYLDEDGQTTFTRPVKMIAFVAGNYERYKRRRKLVALNILRISETNYMRFLRVWVAWLRSSGLADLEAAE
jgi:hypothetical protein